jgi:phytanoyl-CoA hydroxylase
MGLAVCWRAICRRSRSAVLARDINLHTTMHRIGDIRRHLVRGGAVVAGVEFPPGGEVAVAGSSSASGATEVSTRDVSDLEVDAADAELTAKAARIYSQHGCVVIRGLNGHWVGQIAEAVERTVEQSRRLEQQGQLRRLDEGWVTPDGTLFIPAPAYMDSGGSHHQPVVELVKRLGDAAGVPKQVMVPAVDYQNSAALFQCACDGRVLDIVAAIFQSQNIELFGNGQLVYKEPVGGHAVNIHQDAAFFEFGGSGLSPVGTLNYCVDTNSHLGNGPLTVFPGSHRHGFIPHADSCSHLGLEEASGWTLEAGVSIDGNAGDAVFFHQCVRCSQRLVCTPHELVGTRSYLTPPTHPPRWRAP